jgi:hypothetical protein
MRRVSIKAKRITGMLPIERPVRAVRALFFYNYRKSWDYLDSILISRDREISFDKQSINVHKTKFNTYKDTGKPYRFDGKTGKGVSDHFPMVARINLD